MDCPNRGKTRTVMLTICILLAAASIVLAIGAVMDKGPVGDDGNLILHYWFDREGGMLVSIGMFVMSVVTGIVGLFSKDESRSPGGSEEL